MAVRIRLNGTILCAAMHPAQEGDFYIDDELHYLLAVELGFLVTDENHLEHGEWWWNPIPFENSRGANLETL